MKITEKVTVTHSVHFEQEDLDVILAVLEDVWSFSSVHALLNAYSTGFVKVLTALNRVRESAWHNSDLTIDDDKSIEALMDTCCTYESKHGEDDPLFPAVDAIWRALIALRRSDEWRNR